MDIKKLFNHMNNQMKNKQINKQTRIADFTSSMDKLFITRKLRFVT